MGKPVTCPKGAARAALSRPDCPDEDVTRVLNSFLVSPDESDIALLGIFLLHRTGGSVKDTVRETRRRLQEFFYRLSEIDSEEEVLIRESPPKPSDPNSKWMAVRLGTIVFEGKTRPIIEALIGQRQEQDPTFTALVVEVSQLPIQSRSGRDVHLQGL